MMDILYIFQFSESPISRGTFTNYEFFASVTEKGLNSPEVRMK